MGCHLKKILVCLAMITACLGLGGAGVASAGPLPGSPPAAVSVPASPVPAPHQTANDDFIYEAIAEMVEMGILTADEGADLFCAMTCG